MANTREITGLIKQKLQQGTSKAQIQSELSSNYETKDFEKILRDFPETSLKNQYKTLNIVLLSILVIVTLFKALSILGLGAEFGLVGTSVFLIIGFLINVCLIYYITTFRASAYIATAGFTVLGIVNILEEGRTIFQSGNTVAIGVYSVQLLLVVSIIVLSYILLKNVHPNYSLFFKKKER